MRLNGLLCVMLVPLLCSASCVTAWSEPAAEVPAPKPSEVALSHVGAVLSAGEGNITNLGETKLNVAAELNAAQFLDENTGWVGDRRALYRTSDGGRTWERLQVELPPASYISSFFFVNGQQGWLLTVTQDDAERYGHGRRSRVMATGDGGRTWFEQASFNDEVNLRHVEFLNASDGLAVGEKVVAGRPSYVEVFAVGTNDGGRTWADVSGGINSAIKNEHGVANDYGVDVYRPAPSRILLLTGLGRVVSSSDGGKSWNTLARIPASRPQTGYRKIGSGDEGSISITSADTGEEGLRGSLVVKHNQNMWVSYDLPRIPIFDAVFLSDKEVIACGGELQDLRTPGGGSGRVRLTGIILRSTDGGKTWTVLHRSKLSRPFVSITHVGRNHFYAVSEAGVLLRFVLQRK